MRITCLGHAGLRVDGADLRLLMDPWLSDRGAFQAAWFQFPANAHLDRHGAAGLRLRHRLARAPRPHGLVRADRSWPRRRRCSIPAVSSRQTSATASSAAGVVKRHREVPAWSRFRLNERGDWLTFIPEQSPMCHDAGRAWSALAAHPLLHCNDARLTAGPGTPGGRWSAVAVWTYWRRRWPSATWHPVCYEYPPEQIAEISAAQARREIPGRAARLAWRGQTGARRPLRRPHVLP